MRRMKQQRYTELEIERSQRFLAALLGENYSADHSGPNPPIREPGPLPPYTPDPAPGQEEEDVEEDYDFEDEEEDYDEDDKD